MTATKIDGTAIAKGIRERLGEQIKKTQQTNPRYMPSLVIIQGMLMLDKYRYGNAAEDAHSRRQVRLEYDGVRTLQSRKAHQSQAHIST